MCESVSLRIIITSLIFTNISYKFFTGCKIIKKKLYSACIFVQKIHKKACFLRFEQCNS